VLRQIDITIKYFPYDEEAVLILWRPNGIKEVFVIEYLLVTESHSDDGPNIDAELIGMHWSNGEPPEPVVLVDEGPIDPPFYALLENGLGESVRLETGVAQFCDMLNDGAYRYLESVI
jgi:hypothetical protein